MLTVQQYREITGITDDPPSDVGIRLALSRYTSLIEGFTGRSFALVEGCETHHRVGTGPIQLNRYPVTRVVSINGSPDLSPYTIHRAAGIIYHDGLLAGKDVEVVYQGGYADVPYDLKIVLSTLVQAYLAGTHGGVEALEVGRKEVVFGVSSIDAGNSAQQLEPYGDLYAELGPYVSVLGRYREPSLA
jgi:hypothetical protein